MKIKTTEMSGRKGWELSNDMFSLFVMAGGGHIARLRLESRKSVNPFWIPTWKSIEPWQYRRRDAARYACKLLSCVCGHNLCLGAFGEPSAEETAAGLENHGETSVVRWRCMGRKKSAKSLTFRYGCDLPIAQMKIVRTIVLKAGSCIARISERVTNTARRDVPFTMCQHVTFGPPFLEPEVTVFDASATRGETMAGVFGKPQRLKSSARFAWPNGPGPKGRVDLRRMGKGRNGDFSTLLMNPKSEHAWFSAVNPRQGLMVAYVWRRQDYPWLGIWEERFSRKENPWNGKSFTRGMEFTNTPFPIGLRKSVDIGTFQGRPSFRWLPALSTLKFDYSMLAIPVDSDCKGVARIVPKKSGFGVDLIV
ncbi:hypothetical protein ACFLQR_01380 [Verrucomicrobiota bacterium]